MKYKILNFIKSILNAIVLRSTTITGEIDKYIYFDRLSLRDDDIYLVTFLKSGTTWMQMILYQMTTDGNMDFNHIYEVSPWITNEAINGKDSQRVNDLPSPRIFKFHDPYTMFDPKLSNKIIYVYRDGMDTAISLHNHLKNYNNPTQTIEETFNKYFSHKEEYNWFTFTNNWLENKHKLNIHYVKYEDLKENFEDTVLQISKFLEIAISEVTLSRIKERCSFEFMKEHETKFGEQPKDQRVYNQFIRKGQAGEGEKMLNEEQKMVFNDLYEKYIKKYDGLLNN